ncbi:MAG: hypothetical protein E7411_06005 [Ruminococcaceae bacterium]|nr:hypothetical protein [Oscillospiraceae bacterium]
MKYGFMNVENFEGEILKGEIPNVVTSLYKLDNNEIRNFEGKEDFSRIFIISKGNVTVNNIKLYERGICAFLPEDRVEIKADTSCVILEINVKGDMNEADKSFLPYYLNYNDAVTYKEDCKSEKTVSRFLLKHRILPDIAIGSVETEGPDKVGVHDHPLVEQLFYSFEDNDCNLEIDGELVPFKKNTLFHIPLGSSHGVDIPEDGKAHYVWIDYIFDKRGLEYMDEAHN